MRQPERELTLGGQGLLKAGKHGVEQIGCIGGGSWLGDVGLVARCQAMAGEDVGHDLADVVDAPRRVTAVVCESTLACGTRSAASFTFVFFGIPFAPAT